MGSIVIKMNIEFVALAVWIDDTLAGIVLPAIHVKAKENIELVICEHLAAEEVLLNPETDIVVDTSFDTTWKFSALIKEDGQPINNQIIELSPVTVY